MTTAASFAARALLWLLALGVLAACDAPVRLGQPCERTSQCASPYACLFGRCRVECVEHRDCPLESECTLGADGTGVCRVPEDVCTDDSQCAAPLVCGDDALCRAACTDDTDCPSGSSCRPSASRLVCVRDDVAPLDGGASDAGADAGVIDAGERDAGGMSCSGGLNPFFDQRLDGWCIAGSPNVADPTEHVTEAGGVARLAIDGVSAQRRWVRIFQELALDEAAIDSFAIVSADVTSGAVVVVTELLDAGGTVIGRFGAWRGATELQEEACAAIGEPATCSPFSGNDVAVIHPRELGRLRIDVRGIARVRRGLQVIAAPGGSVSARFDGVARSDGACAAAWWRADRPRPPVYDELDRPWTALSPGLSWRPDAAVRMFPVAGCAAAVALDGTQWLDTTAPVPVDGPITIEMWWHPRLDSLPAPSEDRALIWQHDGDFQVRVDGGRLRAEMGRCAAGGPALQVVSPMLIEPVDRDFHELEVLVDFAMPRLCLARNGRRVGECATEPSCPILAPSAAPIRFGARDTPDSGWMGAIDEIRVHRANRFPGSRGAPTGQCYVDRVCAPGGPASVRDLGSFACIDASATTCDVISACPDHARDGTACGGGPVACALGQSECLLRVGPCDRSSPCANLAACEDTIAADLASCETP